MYKEEITVDVCSIALDDETYRITTKNDLIDSVKTAGVINFPIAFADGKNFKIVSGFRRIKSCIEAGFDSVKLRVLREADKKDIVKIAILENSTQRELNIIEQSRAFKLLETCFKDDELCKQASCLGLPAGMSYIKKLRQLYYLPDVIIKGIIEDTIALPAALELGGMQKEISEKLGKLFNNLRPSLNVQREIITFLKEIAARERVTIDRLIDGNEIADILESKEMGSSEKIREIRGHLKRLRFPSLTDVQERFDSIVKKMNLGSNMRIDHSPGFEGRGFTLNIRFADVDDIKDACDRLDFIIKNNEIEGLFRLI